MKFSMKKANDGFSLIELLLVLGVIAILLVAAFVVYPQVRTKQMVNKELVGLRTITASIQSMYASKKNYLGFSANTLVQAHLVPSNMRNLTNGRATNMAGAAMTFTPYGESDTSLSGTYRPRIRVFSPNIPEEACVDLALGVSDFSEHLYVGAASSLSFSEAYKFKKGDDISEVIQNCSGSPTKTYSLYYFFR